MIYKLCSEQKAENAIERSLDKNVKNIAIMTFKRLYYELPAVLILGHYVNTVMKSQNTYLYIFTVWKQNDSTYFDVSQPNY